MNTYVQESRDILDFRVRKPSQVSMVTYRANPDDVVNAIRNVDIFKCIVF